MSRKWFLVMNGIGIILLAAALTVWGSSPAQAQCGDNPPQSSCITCHTQEDPINNIGEWHEIHSLKDCCTNCHGGNCKANEKELAHQDLVANPLVDIYVGCHGCHPDDYLVRAERFAMALGVTPGSSPTPTAVSIGPIIEHPIIILPTSLQHTQFSVPWLLVLGILVSIVLVLFGLLILYSPSRMRR